MGERKNIISAPYAINRAFLACDYIIKNYSKKSKILDMACGFGYVCHVLSKKEYVTTGFDISKEAIKIAKNKAAQLNQNQDNFIISNENFLNSLEDSSFDAVLGLGYLRYLDNNLQNKVYNNVKRILKKDGTFILDHQNILYEMFALNNESLIFWENFISSYCDLSPIFKKDELLRRLNEHIKTPIRKRAKHSASAKMNVSSENPLAFKEKINSIGFELLDILYPFSEIIPPFLQKEVDAKKLEKIQREISLKNFRNWRSMFMCFQFLTILKKI